MSSILIENILMKNFSFEQIIGSCLAVILAILPAILLKINQLHVLVNSRLTELLEVTRDAAKTEGIVEGRDNVRAEMAAQAADSMKRDPPCTV
jgi:hypothetical protein